jgi:pimeloyl-ACP methyl ester carboxylesterase
MAKVFKSLPWIETLWQPMRGVCSASDDARARYPLTNAARREPGFVISVDPLVLLTHFVLLFVSLALGCSSEREAPAGGTGGEAGSGASRDAGDDLGEIRMTQITVGSHVFEARVAGPEDGEVVFLLHGFPQTSHEWRDVLPALGRAGYRAIAPDQRGYSPGARPSSVEDYSIVHLVSDVVGMADAVGAERFHIVGHDWGAAVTWGLATLLADRVITATPMSVPHPDAFSALLADPDSAQYEASAYFEFFSAPNSEDAFLADDAALFRGMFAGIDPAAVDEYLRVLGTKEALGAALNWYRANVAGRNLTGPAIGPTPVPTLYIWSDGDVALVREGVDLTEQYVTGPYRLEVLEGIDHWLVDRAPERVTELLLAHLGR